MDRAAITDAVGQESEARTTDPVEASAIAALLVALARLHHSHRDSSLKWLWLRT
jgi:hypothetical protein